VIIRIVLLLAATFFLALAFQTFELISQHSAFSDAFARQQAPFARTIQLRQDTQGLAAETAALADKGNNNAKAVMDELRRAGIELHPAQPAAPAATH
jgi:hypothetical protein